MKEIELCFETIKLQTTCSQEGPTESVFFSDFLREFFRMLAFVTQLMSLVLIVVSRGPTSINHSVNANSTSLSMQRVN